MYLPVPPKIARTTGWPGFEFRSGWGIISNTENNNLVLVITKRKKQ